MALHHSSALKSHQNELLWKSLLCNSMNMATQHLLCKRHSPGRRTVSWDSHTASPSQGWPSLVLGRAQLSCGAVSQLGWRRTSSDTEQQKAFEEHFYVFMRPLAWTRETPLCNINCKKMLTSSVWSMLLFRCGMMVYFCQPKQSLADLLLHVVLLLYAIDLFFSVSIYMPQPTSAWFSYSDLFKMSTDQISAMDTISEITVMQTHISHASLGRQFLSSMNGKGVIYI